MIKLLLKSTVCFCLIIAFGLTLSGCSNESLAELQAEDSLNRTTLFDKQNSSKKNKRNFTAHLSGDNEVPAVDTKATGQVIVHINKDELSIHFKIIVANVRSNIVGAHFHMAPSGQNGPVVVNLLNTSDFPPETNAPVNGILAEGTIEEGDLGEKPFSDLISAIRAGNIYINVHTMANPSGEIRGQL